MAEDKKEQPEQHESDYPCCFSPDIGHHNSSWKDLGRQYDDGLHLIYHYHWQLPTQEKSEKCCCYYSCKHDENIRKRLKQVLPPYAFWLLTLTGAIPPPFQCLSCLLAIFWGLALCAIAVIIVNDVLVFCVHFACRYMESTCYIIEAGLTYPAVISCLFNNLTLFLSIILVHTHVRGLLHSTELHTLISISDPKRDKIRSLRLNYGW